MSAPQNKFLDHGLSAARPGGSGRAVYTAAPAIIPNHASRVSDDSFDCAFCGARHDLRRDRTILASGTLRGRRADYRAPETTPDYLVLIRAFRYSPAHAKAVVKAIEDKSERITA